MAELTALDKCIDECAGWDFAEDCRNELAELRKDGERLEWLMKTKDAELFKIEEGYFLQWKFNLSGPQRETKTFTTPRQAIDAAMEADNEK